MKRQVLLLLSLLSSLVRADPEKEASTLFEQHPGFPATKESLEGSLREKAPEYVGIQPSKTLQELTTLFEENRDSGRRDLDPIRSLLGTQVKTQESVAKDKSSPAPSLLEVEGLLNKKHRYRISKEDSIFSGHQSVQEEKSKKDKDNSIIEQAGVKFGASFDKRSQDGPKIDAEKTVTCREGAQGTLQSCIKRLVIEMIPQPPIVKTVTTYVTVTRKVTLPLSYSPWYCFYFMDERVPQQTKVSVPQPPKLKERWEGCEDLERKQELGACTLGESVKKSVNESRKIEGFPDLVKQDFWEEERHYLCGFGTHKNHCEKLAQQGCEQIDSKCVVEKAGICLEFEQTYQCGKSGFQASSSIPSVEASFLSGKKQPGFEQYNLADFGMAMTHFHALKEMRSEMKDGLGGIGGSPENPTIFHGKTERCTIKGGKFIQDCCHLKGILQNILGGGCRESEKLATAHLREKRCHLVQKRYCTHQIKLGLAKVCVEWKDAYCCYGSELARIIQEIAHDDASQTALRAYNSAHGIETGWGVGASPNCQSLNAEQLSLINFDTPFAQQHLSQLFKAFEQQAEAKFKAIEEKAGSDEGMVSRAKRAEEGLKRHFSETAKSRPKSSFREGSK